MVLKRTGKFICHQEKFWTWEQDALDSVQHIDAGRHDDRRGASSNEVVGDLI